jgi:two-component system, cell cycle sensor histidine kinase and response regulator CckA
MPAPPRVPEQRTSITVAGLRLSEELNRRLIEATPCGLVHVEATGAIVAANAEAQRILGQTYDALTQRLTSDFDSETVFEDGSHCRAEDYPVSRALATGQAQPPMTIGVRRTDGTTSWAVYTAVPVLDPATGVVSGAVVTLLDVTDRKRFERALVESEARLRSVLDSAPNMIMSADREGRILFINRPVPPQTSDEVIGKSIYDFVRSEDVAKVRACVEGVLASGKIDAYEIHSGVEATTWYSVHVGPIRYGDEIAGVTMVTWDITERRALEARLAMTDRLASIGTLVAGVAHEINNPLMYMLGNLDFMRRRIKGSPEADSLGTALDAAAEGAGRIRDIVRDLSSFSHDGERRWIAVDVHELIESSLRIAASQLRFRAHVRRDFRPVPPLSVNTTRLGQVFLNLILNAAQAIPEGNVAKNEVRVSTKVDDAGIFVFEVADTGSGIAPELIGRVFDPFVTTKPAGVGTGLGLHICRSIVTAMGGDILVTSRVGVGTSFVVKLPLNAGALGDPPPDEARRPVVGCRILVVDDETSVANVVRRMLEGHDVDVALSGREAISRLREADYDLILCDLIMPDVTGIDVYEALRSRGRGEEQRIVFMTGGAFTDGARRFLDVVPNRWLEKPFDRAALERALPVRAAR